MVRRFVSSESDRFRTVIPVEESRCKIGFEDGVLLLGSCFTENIGERLKQFKYPNVDCNPFGISYNPLTICRNINRLLTGNPYSPEDLGHYNDQYFSFDHHSSFNSRDSDECLKGINTRFLKARELLRRSKIVFITFGSSWVYVSKDTNREVANCHKLPANQFSRRIVGKSTPFSALNFFINHEKGQQLNVMMYALYIYIHCFIFA